MKSDRAIPHARKGTSVPWLFVFLSMCLLSLPALTTESFAASLTGDSRTYVQSRETMDGKKLLPFYEYLNLSVQDLPNDSVSIHLGGWMYLLGSNALGSDKRQDSDLQYGYVSYRANERNGVVNLGRVMVFEGVAAERIDGIYARTDIKGGFGISAFGGAPVETGDDLPGNNTIYGARLSHQYAGLYTVGLSYLNQEKNDLNFREEQGIDLWVKPINKVEVMGRSAYNMETNGWMEHTYYLVLGPFANLRFNTEASWINYEDYFTGVTTPALKLTPDWSFIYAKERVNILGEEVVYEFNKNWSFSVDYKSYGYHVAGGATYYGAKATYAVPKAYNAGIAFHKMDGETNALKYKYDEFRIYASKKMNKVDLAIDVIDIKYAEPINDVTNAYSATIAAGYEFAHNVKAGLDVEYAKNPEYDKDVRVFAKVIWGFDAGSGSSTPAKTKEGN